MVYNDNYEMTENRKPGYNMGLASCGVKCLNSSAVFQINFSAGLTVLCPEIPHERQAQKRYMLCCATSSEISLSQIFPTTSTKFKKSVFNSSWSENGVAYP